MQCEEDQRARPIFGFCFNTALVQVIVIAMLLFLNPSGDHQSRLAVCDLGHRCGVTQRGGETLIARSQTSLINCRVIAGPVRSAQGHFADTILLEAQLFYSLDHALIYPWGEGTHCGNHDMISNFSG